MGTKKDGAQEGINGRGNGLRYEGFYVEEGLKVRGSSREKGSIERGLINDRAQEGVLESGHKYQRELTI